MKKLFFIALLLISASALRAQNVYNYTGYTVLLSAYNNCSSGCPNTLQVMAASTPGIPSPGNPLSGTPTVMAQSLWMGGCVSANPDLAWVVRIDPAVYTCTGFNQMSGMIAMPGNSCPPLVMGLDFASNIVKNACTPASVPTTKISFYLDTTTGDIYLHYN